MPSVSCLEYSLKKAVSEKIEEMREQNLKSSTMVYDLPQQNEDGSYPAFRAVYGDGKLLDVARRGTSEETWDIADFWIIDEDENKVFMARDRFGVKPFFYTLAEGRFIFASEILGEIQNFYGIFAPRKKNNILIIQ